MADTKTAQKVSEKKRIEERWGKALAAAGWTALPSTILIYQRKLGLDPLALNIVMQIAQYWWEPEKHPYPSKSTLAAAIGVTPRAVQRRIAAMEKVHLIERIERKDGKRGSQSNIYRLTGLAAKAEPYAKQLLAERASKKASETARTKPALRRVK
jgi:DNA-binding transcriptional ArsR family regulator